MLFQGDAEILFPAHVIPSLRNLRSEDWGQFIDGLLTQHETTPDGLAFGLLMIRLNGCMSCTADSFRAMRGCGQCARQVISRFKGSDQDLIENWRAARTDILNYLENGEPPQVE